METELSDVNEIALRFVPQDTPDIVGLHDEMVGAELTFEDRVPLILKGHTGLAKTRLLHHIHGVKSWPYRSFNANGRTEVDTLVGKWIVIEGSMRYILGIVPFCMKYGISLGIEEINMVDYDVNLLFYEYLDHGYITLPELDVNDPDYVIHAHSNFRLWGTMNPPEWYRGRKELDAALARRVRILDVEPPDERDELQIIANEVPDLDPSTVRGIRKIAEGVRNNFEANLGTYWMSPADCVLWAHTAHALGGDRASVHLAARLTIYAKVPRIEVDRVKLLVRTSFGEP